MLTTFLGIALLASGASSVADDAARPRAPSAVVRDGTAFFLAGADQPGIFRCERDGRCELWASGSRKQRTPLSAVSALAIDRNGTLFAADRSTREVYRIERGKPPVPLSGGAFEVPSGLAIDPVGRLVVCDLRLGLVARLARDGGVPEPLGRVPAPRGVGIAPGGGIVVLSMGPDQLVRLNSDKTVRPLVGGTPFRFPLALVRDGKAKRWLVSDGYARTVWAVSDAGAVSPLVEGDPLVRPSGLCLDDAGAVIIADPGAGQIFRAVGPDEVHPWTERH